MHFDTSSEDGWENEGDGLVISRFSIALLAAVLLGMSLGYHLPADCRILATAAGIIGFVFFALQTFYARRMNLEHNVFLQQTAERRLQYHVRPRRPMTAVME